MANTIIVTSTIVGIKRANLLITYSRIVSLAGYVPGPSTFLDSRLRGNDGRWMGIAGMTGVGWELRDRINIDGIE
jgi:hypothetical protein